MEAHDMAAMREADASRSDKILQAKSGFVVQGQEVFGRYCKIEMMRYGVPNEFFIHKCITILNSNFYTDVPVVCGEGDKWHEEGVDVVSVITCGVDESKVFRVPLKDVEFVSLPSNCYGQSDQMTSYGNEAAKRQIDAALGKPVSLERKQFGDLQKVVTELQYMAIAIEQGKATPFGADVVRKYSQRLNAIVKGAR